MNFLFTVPLFFCSFSPAEQSHSTSGSPGCPDHPSVQVKTVALAEDNEYDEFRFCSPAGEKRVLLKHLKSAYQADCNSLQAIAGHYEWQYDTLVLYKFWCHAGDYTGKEWGAYRARYKWDCNADAFNRIDAMVYIESLSDEGGAPLSTGEMKDEELVQHREDFKRDMARREEAEFMIGKAAQSLIKEVKSSMKPILKDLEASFVGEEYGFGYRVWE